MKLILATLEHRSICKCGYDLVREEIPTHKTYIVDEDSICRASFVCGGCGKMTDVHAILTFDAVENGYQIHGRFPVEVLELHKETILLEA